MKINLKYDSASSTLLHDVAKLKCKGDKSAIILLLKMALKFAEEQNERSELGG